VLQTDQHVLEERVADVRMVEASEQDDADQLRAAANERAGGGTRCVVERTRCGEDPLPRRGTDVAVAVEDARNG
jgi:hypothetical protein